MGTPCRLVETYRQSDFDGRLQMWLEHRDMRYAYEEVEIEELTPRATPETSWTRLLTHVWNRMFDLLTPHR